MPLVGGLVVLVALTGLGASAVPRWLAPRADETVEGAAVRRGPLSIRVTSSGHLAAADTVRLTSGVEGRTAILWIAPEGTQVEQGEVVCELDVTLLVERRIEQTIRAGNAEAALVKANQARAIQVSQNRSDTEAAARAIAFAEQDLEMFLEGERALELEKSQQAIDLAREEAQRAQGRLTWSEELSQKGFLTAIELEADRIAEHRSTILLQQATREKELLERYRMPRRESELRGLLSEARLEMERVELQASARLVDYDSDVRSAQASLELEKEKLARLEAQIEKARLRAPRDGYVVYAIKDDDDPPIGQGVEVREREEILAIPSSDGMTAELKLHESVLKQVQVGQACTVRVDALPGVELEGEVQYVAMLPDQNSRWSNPNLRVYRCQVAIRTAHSGLRPGMSCAIEIRVDDLADALYVPAQSVFRDGERTLAFVAGGRRPERRAVEIGRYTELWVQILAGLEEGETVLLHAPPGFTATEGERKAADG
ncbi:MAG TPA: efflux RND transporter periplasmic adaptor subunit [Planctomycetota bacterium]